MFFSPFDQFEIYLINSLQVQLWYFQAIFVSDILDIFTLRFDSILVTNAFVIIVLGLILILLFQKSGTNLIKIIPGYWQGIVELFYNFLLNLLLAQAGYKSLRFFGSIFSIFFFILTYNLLGLLPFGFTVTGHIILTFTIAISFFIGWIIIALLTLRLKFFRIFLPRNIPVALAPLLIVIEILSFSIRPMSLSIRLFANMLAGHILLFIISTAVLVMANLSIFIGLLPFLFVVIFFVLEIGIAFLQAYVFTILLSIYLADALKSH